ncbi:Coiled-coil domain-containing protein r3hcc1l, partial [Dermatophagoides pteronyssinus]
IRSWSPSQFDDDFIQLLTKDIESFFAQSYPKSQKFIFILPPLPPKFRFLIHEVVPQIFGDKLSTLSIGSDKKRRPIIYLKSFFENQKNQNDSLLIITNLPEKLRENRKKPRHPDKQLYQPPKSRKKISNPVEFSNHNRKMQQEDNDDNDDLSWDNLYDDNGDIINDLNTQFETINIRLENVQKSTANYSKFIDKNLDNSSAQPPPPSPSISSSATDYSHILEIYDISPDLKTKDLTACLSFNNFKNFEIDWVDDTHALVTFQSNIQATEAMNRMFPIMKVRPIGQATNESKQKAKKIKDSDVTRKLRPETSAITAKRLVIGALGLKSNQIIDPKQREAEREKLRLAKEKTLRESKNIWNDDS